MHNLELFQTYYKEEKKNIERTIEKFNGSISSHPNELIKKNLNYFKELNSDGKLVRGILIDLGYSLLKENKEYSYALALAYELFQTSILVHDDIIDQDNIRRGKETIHNKNFQEYSKYSQEEARHLSNSIGICMGDYGFYLANKVIGESYAMDNNLGRIFMLYSDIVLKTIEGEIIDVALPFESKYIGISEDLEKQIFDIYKSKTAYYTIIGPLQLGLALAGADEEKLNIIESFGEKIGIAFQIQDDILGIYSNEMGKIQGSDIKEYKQTILFSHILTTEYKEEFLKIYGKQNLTDEEIERIKELFEKSLSKQYAIDIMNKLYDEGIKLLKEISWISNEYKSILEGFVEFLRSRNK